MKIKFVLVFVLCFLVSGFVVNDKVFAQTVTIYFNDGSTASGTIVKEGMYIIIIKKADGTEVEINKSKIKKIEKGGSSAPQQQKVVWLNELNPVSQQDLYVCSGSSYYYEGQLVINGVIYDNSFRMKFVDEVNRGFVVYNLNKKYDVFETYIGLEDRNCSKFQKSNTVNFYGDGVLLKEITGFEMGPAQLVSVSVKDINSLKLEYVGADSCDNCFIVIGSPKLIIGALPSQQKNEETTNNETNTNTSTETQSCEGGSVVIEPKSLEELANKLAEQVKESTLVKEGEKLQLAVAKFKLVKICDSAVADNTLEDLSTYLLKTKVFKLIERGQLDKALQEIGLGESGFIDPEKAIELGKMVGAQAILIGSVSDRGTFVVINARIINTKTGEADIAENVEMRK